ncbi:MAG: tRNA pseudouridine synthase tRNA pseudouridsynthase [Candidatus Parcubacteria bacterium]|jgi:tRNA pseudouridine(55) synthase
MELLRYCHKNLGETPLECLRRFQAANPEYLSLPATYAGRLDPAAEGQILFLFGDMVHEKDAYLAHDKTYTATFALGVSTDTYDLLGLPQQVVSNVALPDEEKMKELLKEIKNIKVQMYPAYSSRPVDGKPLFAYAREGITVERPMRRVDIFSCDLVRAETIKRNELIKRVENICNLVKGDFRQTEILTAWQNADQNLPEKIPLITLTLNVSSGTYVRSLTEECEKVLGVPAVLFSLIREQIISATNSKSTTN